MMIEIALWHLITLLVSFFGFVAGIAKYLLSQMEKRQNERDETQDVRWTERLRHMDARLIHFSAELKETSDEWGRLERDLLHLKAELPIHYVRREDYIRGQSVLEAKMDALYSRMELVITRGIKND